MQTLNTVLDSTLAMYAGLAAAAVLIGGVKLAGALDTTGSPSG